MEIQLTRPCSTSKSCIVLSPPKLEWFSGGTSIADIDADGTCWGTLGNWRLPRSSKADSSFLLTELQLVTTWVSFSLSGVNVWSITKESSKIYYSKQSSISLLCVEGLLTIQAARERNPGIGIWSRFTRSTLLLESIFMDFTLWGFCSLPRSAEGQAICVPSKVWEPLLSPLPNERTNTTLYWTLRMPRINYIKFEILP